MSKYYYYYHDNTHCIVIVDNLIFDSNQHSPLILTTWCKIFILTHYISMEIHTNIINFNENLLKTYY